MPVTWDTGNDTSASTVWTVWISSNNSTASTTDVWTGWTTNGTVTATTSSDVWSIWSSAGATVHITQAYTAPVETEEQRLARVEAAKVAAREAQESQERAEALLRTHLTEEQAAELAKGDYFDVIAQSGERYRIFRGRQRNITLIQGGKATKRFCIHPAEAVPDPDTMLAQKLMLETSEADFLRIANAAAA